VSVQHDGHEVFLTAGQSWPAAPPPASDLAGAPLGEATPDAGQEEVAPSSPADGSELKHGANAQPSRRKLDSRELADLNERFARAMTLKKNGEPQKALRVLDRLAKRYPGSPLAQELRVERLRLLRAVGRSRAAAIEAARYLREYPNGYAAAEARELVPGRR